MGQHRRSVEAVAALVSALGPGPWSLDQVRAQGWTPGALRAAVAAGRLVRPARGVLAPPESGDPRADLLARVRAALLTAPPGAVVSHATAAQMHGIWLPRQPSSTVHLTVPGDHDDTDHDVRLHGSALPPDLVMELDGIELTSLARTAVDVARGRSLATALVPLDSAVRLLAGARGTADLRDERDRAAARSAGRPVLWSAYQSVWSWPGTRAVRRALDHLEPGSESPFESSSRGWMIASGLPAPRVGAPVVGRSGRGYVGDFVWESARVIGEADGLGKYGADDVAVRRSLRAERERQRDLEAAGWRVIRWDTSERPASWIPRLRQTIYASPLQLPQTSPRLRHIEG